MPTTITAPGGYSVVPALVHGFESERTVNNRVHRVLDSGTPDVVLYPATLRSGQMEYLFDVLNDALECETMHSLAEVITLVSTEVPSINMDYIATDAVVLTLEDERALWLVRVGFQEV